MSNVVNSFLEYGFNLGQLWLSILPLVPFIIIIFVLIFSINKLREFINDYNNIFIDQPGDDWASKGNRYSYFKEKYDL